MYDEKRGVSIMADDIFLLLPNITISVQVKFPSNITNCKSEMYIIIII